MATATTPSTVTLTINEEERAFLLNFLEQSLREKKVEEHRTDAFDYKEFVRRQEALVQGLIDRLRRT